jgi:TPP-dependent pyruvate/acetoin dehydrogenase alpha subunit
MDVLNTYAMTQEALRVAREERQPVLLEAETYRFRGHSMADPEEYRTKEQVEAWRRRDPIETFGRTLVDQHILREEEIADLDAAAIAAVDKAVAYADASPMPRPEELYDDIYVLGGQVRGWYSVDERGEGVYEGQDSARMGAGARAEEPPADDPFEAPPEGAT